MVLVDPLVAAALEAGMCDLRPSGNTVNYASNGIGVSNTQIGFYNGFRVVVDSHVPAGDWHSW